MFLKEKYWHEIFEASILLKALNGVWETISGFALLYINKSTIGNGIIFLTRKELTEDPNDKFIYFLNSQLNHFSSNTKELAAIYILTHGIVNLFLAYNLYKENLWAYKASLFFVAIFLSYLIYRLIISHSPLLFGVIIFDILFAVVTWHEYKYKKSLLPHEAKL